MEKQFKVKVMDQRKLILEQAAVFLELPGAYGYLGIGPNHIDYLARLEPGLLTISCAGQSQEKNQYFVSGGFLKVQNNVVSVLVDNLEHPRDIDMERAKRSEQRAQRRLTGIHQEGCDVERALFSIKKSRARQQLKNHI